MSTVIKISKEITDEAKISAKVNRRSIAVLLGILLNFFYGFWQADPIAAIMIAVYLIVEGIRTLRE